MKLILSALVFCSSAFFIYGIFESRARKRSLHSRLETLDVTNDGISLEEMEMSKSFFERVIKPVILKIGRLLGNYTPRGFQERISHKLTRAGYLKADPLMYLGIKCCSAISFLGFSVLIASLAHVKITEMMLYFIVFPALGLFLPDLIVISAGNRRKCDISSHLPDLLDLLTVSVEAGLGFEQALMHASEKMKGAMSEEIKRVLQEMRLGKKRSESLRALADRILLPDLTSFCAALIQADQLGVSIADVLRVQSDSMRLKRRQRSEEIAMKAPLKLLFPLVFFIFPTLFIILLGPAVLSIMENLKTQ
ncbi:MAG: type II secretion system F family protein [bacterium]